MYCVTSNTHYHHSSLTPTHNLLVTCLMRCAALLKEAGEWVRCWCSFDIYKYDKYCTLFHHFGRSLLANQSILSIGRSSAGRESDGRRMVRHNQRWAEPGTLPKGANTRNNREKCDGEASQLRKSGLTYCNIINFCRNLETQEYNHRNKKLLGYSKRNIGLFVEELFGYCMYG